MNEQIEELSNFLWKNTIIHTEDLCHDVAETVIKAGYCKRSEGKWIRHKEYCLYNKCSVCEHGHCREDNYCPNCGAKLKGGAE